MTIRNLLLSLFVLHAMTRATETARAEEIWAARSGTTTITLDADALQRLGLRVTLVNNEKPVDPAAEISLELAAESTLTFSVEAGAFNQFFGGYLLHTSGLSIRSERGLCTLQPLSIARKVGPAFEPVWTIEGLNDGGGLSLTRYKAGFDPASRTMVIHSPDVCISASMADALGEPRLSGVAIGKVTIRIHADWAGGDAPSAGPEVDGSTSRAFVGPDMTFCQLYQLAQYGRLGDIVGLAVGTTSWNIGDRDLMWFPNPETQHPFIVMNLYRLKSDRFEQIGQSAIKHGFYALGSTQCGTACTFEPGHSAGRWLGVGCTDTYSSSLNASQNGLSPRAEIDPWTGNWVYQGSHLSQGNHSHNAIQHRLQVHDADLNPSQNPGATYYCEGYYAIRDDINVMNSAAWKQVTISGSPGATWTFGMTGASIRPTSGFAIDAWAGTTQTVLAQQVPPIEFVSPDGRCVLAAKSMDLGGGLWRYEYALLNIDMSRKVKSFSIPVPSWVTVSNIGFHLVELHDEPYSSTPWTSSLADGALTWTTVNTPLIWGMLYNFRFDATAAPVSDTTVTLGMYDPGTPATVTGLTVGPSNAMTGNALRGGLLWDKWWNVNGAPAPTGNHPLYPMGGQQSGATTYRCKECHGWDYKGAFGAYGSGPHFTGIRGVFDTTKTAAELFDLIKSNTISNGHGYSTYGLTDQDIIDLVIFIQEMVIDTDRYIDVAGQFLGDAIQGQLNYQTGGWTSCSACHGDDGAAINFGTPQVPEWIGTIAVHNPWELLHKTRFGQPGAPMPSWTDWGGTDQGAADLGRYCQLSFPVDCLTNAHCALGDPCNLIKMCQVGRCVPSTLDGDLTGDGVLDGRDILPFADTLIAGSTDPLTCARADFSGNGLMDTDDVSCMVTTLLGE